MAQFQLIVSKVVNIKQWFCFLF